MAKRIRTRVGISLCETVTVVEFPRGQGTEHDPVRRVRQVIDSDGELLAEHDPVAEEFLDEHFFGVS